MSPEFNNLFGAVYSITGEVATGGPTYFRFLTPLNNTQDFFGDIVALGSDPVLATGVYSPPFLYPFLSFSSAFGVYQNIAHIPAQEVKMMFYARVLGPLSPIDLPKSYRVRLRIRQYRYGY